MALHLITYLIPATFTTRLPDGGLYFWHKQQNKHCTVYSFQRVNTRSNIARNRMRTKTRSGYWRIIP
ncbi:hypothetical protein D5U18_17950 [Salmonella enterica]|nr:hypothetical protein [Salmonella enterica]EAW2072656.1 hypothetical protein [Salmonella enterica subsp. enterica]EBD0225578.1 hypothetical protein [Salmonella enterica subsp. enterica serovar Heidelberg]EBI0471058.1 hypothetical protein [Salmonella enterica subsp. enterica serovar Amager]EAP7263401.1 hypothetical protein [Salmonella enterica]